MTRAPLQKILHVEDEDSIREVAALALGTVGGFTVEGCSGGAQAVERAPAFAPDLVLLDVMMPDMDGPATLAALRALPGLEEVPVVFMTAKVMAEEIARFKDLGAVDVIEKPFDPMTLADRVREIWSGLPD